MSLKVRRNSIFPISNTVLRSIRFKIISNQIDRWIDLDSFKPNSTQNYVISGIFKFLSYLQKHFLRRSTLAGMFVSKLQDEGGCEKLVS